MPTQREDNDQKPLKISININSSRKFFFGCKASLRPTMSQPKQQQTKNQLTKHQTPDTNTKIPKYQNTKTPKYQNTKIPKYQNTKIPNQTTAL